MQRKAFRIEAMLAPRRAMAVALAAREPMAAPQAAENTEALYLLKAELSIIRETIGRNKRELATLIGDDGERRIARAGDELAAAVGAMRGATDTILSIAEAADDNARTLAASLNDDFKRGLAQDIQEQIVRIFEACNFQDIAGQHINKVIGTLNTMEEQLAGVMARYNGVQTISKPRAAAAKDDGLLNGPKISGDNGHASQSDIDRIFAHG